MTEEKLGKVVAEITEGKFEGENLEIEIGRGPFDSRFLVNGQPVSGVKNATININAGEPRNTVELELYGQLEKIEEDES